MTRDRDFSNRFRQSKGRSHVSIYEMVGRALRERHCRGTLVDVGCGVGGLRPFVDVPIARYMGIDAVRFEQFPADVEFKQADLDTEAIPLPDGFAAVSVAVEVIEHLENPRRFVRELVRIVKPGGWVLITTPNQLSFLSLATLVIKRRFAAFQDGEYPAHRTALLEVDLRRIASECSLENVEIRFTNHGRLVWTPYHYPALLARLFPRGCSDNLLLVGQTPDVAGAG